MIGRSDRHLRVEGSALDRRRQAEASWTKRSRPAPAAHDRVGKTEHKLIRRARGGDQDAFSELVVLHADHVVGALRRFGLDASEADEVAQEVFLRAWRGLARSALASWRSRAACTAAGCSSARSSSPI
jgi:hypothetical protein